MTKNYTATIQQAIDCLSQISNEQYNEIPVHHMSSVGAHVRHITDHFDAIRNGMDRQLIDFEERNRGSQVEFDVQIGLDHLKGLQDWISAMSAEELETECQVQADVGIGEVEIAAAKTCVNRELMFACSHAIHHYSIIKLMLIQLNGPESATMFGVAPSTANYLKAQEEANS